MDQLSARSQRKVNSIVEQAARLFVRHGFHKVTMESIAQYANVSKVTLYKYFTDKSALYEHILLQQLQQDIVVTKDIVTDIIPYHEKWRRLIHYVVSKHQEADYVIQDDSLLLSLDATKQIKEYDDQLQQLRYKLYNQGRMEEFIHDDASDFMLERLYYVITSGLLSEFTNIQTLPESEHKQLIQLLLYGITKSNL